MERAEHNSDHFVHKDNMYNVQIHRLRDACRLRRQYRIDDVYSAQSTHTHTQRIDDEKENTKTKHRSSLAASLTQSSVVP